MGTGNQPATGQASEKGCFYEGGFQSCGDAAILYSSYGPADGGVPREETRHAGGDALPCASRDAGGQSISYARDDTCGLPFSGFPGESHARAECHSLTGINCRGHAGSQPGDRAAAGSAGDNRTDCSRTDGAPSCDGALRDSQPGSLTRDLPHPGGES